MILPAASSAVAFGRQRGGDTGQRGHDQLEQIVAVVKYLNDPWMPLWWLIRVAILPGAAVLVGPPDSNSLHVPGESGVRVKWNAS